MLPRAASAMPGCWCWGYAYWCYAALLFSAAFDADAAIACRRVAITPRLLFSLMICLHIIIADYWYFSPRHAYMPLLLLWCDIRRWGDAAVADGAGWYCRCFTPLTTPPLLMLTLLATIVESFVTFAFVSSIRLYAASFSLRATIIDYARRGAPFRCLPPPILIATPAIVGADMLMMPILAAFFMLITPACRCAYAIYRASAVDTLMMPRRYYSEDAHAIASCCRW